ncbi:MAG: DMT family transporter [Eubacteriales bacterium]|jgi:drug/metabolite transporter (DMT)-like permease|nr:DMT family transporter [Eubacteriales bacterium]
MTNTKYSIWAKLALFTATLIWGSSFFVMKSTIQSIDTYFVISIRFLTAAALLSFIFAKRLKNSFSKEYILKGAILGTAMFIAYAFQTYGVMHTTPGKNAFLTSVYCILVPFLNWIYTKEKPSTYNLLAAVICLAGIGLVSLNESLYIGLGDFLTIICGLFFGIHIVLIGEYAKEKDVIALTIWQFATVGLLAFVFALMFNDFPRGISKSDIYSLLYLCIFATTIALLLQNVGQKYVSPSSASIILSLEAVFGVLFSIVFYKEIVSIKVALGFAVIFIAIIVSQTELRFISRRFKKG